MKECARLRHGLRFHDALVGGDAAGIGVLLHFEGYDSRGCAK